MSTEEKSRKAWTGTDFTAKWMQEALDDPNQPAVQRGKFSYTWKREMGLSTISSEAQAEETKLPLSEEAQAQVGKMYKYLDAEDALERQREGR